MYLSVKEVAARLSISEALVYTWVESGQLAHFRLGGQGKRGAIRVDETDLERFLATRKKNGRQGCPPPAPVPRVKLKHLQL
jgi:excisionase family DNA binding protein